MLLLRLLLVLVVVVAPLDDRKKKGRQGNKEYGKGKFTAAEVSYQAGLNAASQGDDAISSRLSNNLGCALNRQEKFDLAKSLLQRAFETAESAEDKTRAAYNAGNTSFQAQDPAAALDYYKKALLSDPGNEEARFNYEFVRRMLDQQPQQQQQQQGDSDQEQDRDQQQEQQEQQPDEDQQQQQEQSESTEPEDEGEEQQPEPQERENEMTPDQAEQILQALQTDEEELMRQVWKMRGKPKKVDKDW
jgi:tetratricopeptide (TPR) repeat protein